MKMSLGNLPDLMLFKILKFMNRKEQGTLSLVHPSWNDFLNKYMRSALVVGSDMKYEVSYPKPLTDSAVSSDNFKPIYKDLQAMLKDTKVPEERLPLKPFQLDEGRAIRKLVLVGKIEGPHIMSLIYNCAYLEHLLIHLSVLFSVDTKRMQNEEDYLVIGPRVKTLVVDDSDIMEDLGGLFVEQVFEGFMWLMKSVHFPILDTLNLALPYYEPREHNYIGAITSFMNDHAETLKRFALVQSLDMAEDGDICLENCEWATIKTLGVNARQLKGLNLEEIDINLARRQTSDGLWKNFITHQTNMKKLIFMNVPVPFPEDVLGRNAETLTTVILHLNTPGDLCHFEKCVHLTKLTLAGHTKNLMSMNPGLKNFKFLPTTIQSLKIYTIPVAKEDLDVCLNFANLEDLTLKGLGFDDGCGMRLKTLGELWKKKQLKHIEIFRSLNSDSFEERNLPECVQIFSTLNRNNIRDFTLECSLQPNGYEYSYGRVNKESKYVQLQSELDTDLFKMPSEKSLFREEPFYLEEYTDDDSDTDDSESEESGSYETIEEEEISHPAKRKSLKSPTKE